MKKIRIPGLVLTLILAGMTLLPAISAFAADKDYRIVLTPKAGDPISIVPPGDTTGGGGLSSNLYILEKEQWTGTFTTNIISNEIDIFSVLGGLQMPGDQVAVDMVRGVFQTAFGTICDEHHPSVIVIDEPPVYFEQGLVMVATADGVITGGTKGFNKAAGESHLYLKFEVGPNPNYPDDPNPAAAIARTGMFMFAFTGISKGEKSCK